MVQMVHFQEVFLQSEGEWIALAVDAECISLKEYVQTLRSWEV
jgi:hypothetical protein